MAKNQKGILSQRKGWDRAKRHGVADRERIDEKEKIKAPGVFPSGLVSLFSATLSTPCWLEGPGVSASGCPLSPVCVVRHALTGLCVQVQSCQRRLNKWLHVFLYVLCVCFWGFFLRFCMLHSNIWRCFSNPPVFTFLLHVVLECPLCPLLPRGAMLGKCLWLQVCGEEFQSADPPAPAAALWHRVVRLFRQAGRMRSCPAWDEVELRINCLLCCWRDDMPQEQRDQAYPYTKKVKQTKKNHRPAAAAPSTQHELPFVFFLLPQPMHTMTLKLLLIYSLFLLQ